MAEEKQEEKTQIETLETRKFQYSNNVNFEFDIEVSKPELAVAEITDFMELMKRAITDLEKLRETYIKKIEKPENEKVSEGSNADKEKKEEKQINGNEKTIKGKEAA